eukprot:scaffold96169_cov65-Phaeocystis_antarctica.AAC.1
MSCQAGFLGWSSTNVPDARVVFANVPDARLVFANVPDKSSQKEVNQLLRPQQQHHSFATAGITGCPPTDLPPTALQPWSARRRAASECRRPVRSAAARRSARAEQSQDDAMTPAGPPDTTPAPSRASSCAC